LAPNMAQSPMSPDMAVPNANKGLCWHQSQVFYQEKYYPFGLGRRGFRVI
jgi:hypothetical protein